MKILYPSKLQNMLEMMSSFGGIQSEFTEEEFLEGYSAPKNPELMRVFRDLDLVEHLGTGIRKILKKYDKSIYHFFPHFIRVSIKYNQNEFEYENNKIDDKLNGLTKIQKDIVQLLFDKPCLTQLELARILGVGERKIRYNMKELIEKKYIRRIGSNKTVEWEVIIKENILK